MNNAKSTSVIENKISVFTIKVKRIHNICVIWSQNQYPICSSSLKLKTYMTLDQLQLIIQSF